MSKVDGFAFNVCPGIQENEFAVNGGDDGCNGTTIHSRDAAQSKCCGSENPAGVAGITRRGRKLLLRFFKGDPNTAGAWLQSTGAARRYPSRRFAVVD